MTTRFHTACNHGIFVDTVDGLNNSSDGERHLEQTRVRANCSMAGFALRGQPQRVTTSSKQADTAIYTAHLLYLCTVYSPVYIDAEISTNHHIAFTLNKLSYLIIHSVYFLSDVTSSFIYPLH